MRPFAPTFSMKTRRSPAGEVNSPIPSCLITYPPTDVDSTKKLRSFPSPTRSALAKVSEVEAPNATDHKTATPKQTKSIFLMTFSFGGAVRSSQFTTIRRIIFQIHPPQFRHRGKTMEKQRLEQIERYVLGFLKEQQQTRIVAKELFASTSTYANADIVRALEDLEKKERLLVRHTSEGNDYISLTAEGADLLELNKVDSDGDSPAVPHPPKSATRNM